MAHHAPGTKTVADLVKFPSFEDPREPENSNPKVELVEEILLSRDFSQGSIEASLVLPAAAAQQVLVPEGHHHPAQPLLAVLVR